MMNNLPMNNLPNIHPDYKPKVRNYSDSEKEHLLNSLRRDSMWKHYGLSYIQHLVAEEIRLEELRKPNPGTTEPDPDPDELILGVPRHKWDELKAMSQRHDTAVETQKDLYDQEFKKLKQPRVYSRAWYEQAAFDSAIMPQEEFDAVYQRKIREQPHVEEPHEPRIAAWVKWWIIGLCILAGTIIIGCVMRG